MPTTTINSYTVSANQYDLSVLRSSDASSKHLARLLVLKNLTLISGNLTIIPQASNVNIAFFDKRQKTLGKFFANSGIINFVAPISDFDDLYQLVRSVGSVNITWNEDSSKPGIVASYLITTLPNPIPMGS